MIISLTVKDIITGRPIIQLRQSLTAGYEDFLKIQRDVRVILEHTVLGIIAPEASILVQNAPKSLEIVRPPSCYGLGWRFGNNFFRV